MVQISIFRVLLDIMNKSDKSKTQFAIAEGMLKNFQDIPKLSIHELAERCFVSSASITRFVRLNGFATYGEFRKQCSQTFSIDIDYSRNVLKANKDDIQPIFNIYSEHVRDNILYNLENIDYEQLNRISDLIYHSNDVVYLGFEFAMILGQHYQIKMAECNKYIQLPFQTKDQMEVAKQLGKNSVAIIASLEGGYFYRNETIIQELKKNNVKIVAITMEHNSKLLRDMDEIILCNKLNSETEGRISLLHIIELMLMYYFINYK